MLRLVEDLIFLLFAVVPTHVVKIGLSLGLLVSITFIGRIVGVAAFKLGGCVFEIIIQKLLLSLFCEASLVLIASPLVDDLIAIPDFSVIQHMIPVLV